MKEESPFYFAAVILHPSLKRGYFRDKWRNWPAWWKHAEKAMEEVFNTYIDELTDEEDENPAEERRRKVPRRPGGDSDDDAYEQSLAVDENLVLSIRQQKKQKLTTELERYYEEGLVLQKIKKDGGEATAPLPDPLNWWLGVGRILYPTLAKIALDLFSIPAMSSACERAFSQAKKVVTDERNRLSADTIEADQCQKWWLIKGLVPSSLIDCINTDGGSTTPWLTSFNVDLTSYETPRTEETLES